MRGKGPIWRAGGIGNYTEIEKILLNDYYPLLDRKEAV